MHRKTPVKPKSVVNFVVEEDIFLETSEADLLGRWRKEILSFTRKDRRLPVTKDVVPLQKN